MKRIISLLLSAIVATLVLTSCYNYKWVNLSTMKEGDKIRVKIYNGPTKIVRFYQATDSTITFYKKKKYVWPDTVGIPQLRTHHLKEFSRINNREYSAGKTWAFIGGILAALGLALGIMMLTFGGAGFI